MEPEGSMQEAINKLKETTKVEIPESSTPEQPIIEEVQEPEAQAQAPEVPETPETEVKAETPPETAPEKVEADDGIERIELESDQFAELLGLKPEQLNVSDDGNIRFVGKVDNESVDVSLDQLLNDFQGDATLTNRSKKLAEERKETLVALQNQTQQFAQQSANLLEGLKEQYLKPFDDVNWKELKAEDPAEYAAQMADKRATEESLSQIANNAISEITQAQEAQNVEMQKQYGEYLTQQQDMVTDKTSKLHIPDFDKTYPEIKSYMNKLGFNEQEQNQVADARILKAFHQSMLFEKGKTGAKKKLATPLPKVFKPGTPPSKQEVSQETESKLRSKLKETGDWKDAVALLRAGR